MGSTMGADNRGVIEVEGLGIDTDYDATTETSVKNSGPIEIG